MIDRRNFLGLGAAVAGTAAFSALPSFAEQESMPPAIAKLTSMRDQAKPITVEERKSRIERARELLTENKLAALVITGGSTLA